MTADLFLDTGVFIAAVSHRDPYREAARQLLHDIRGGTWSRAHTSDYVVAEALNYARARMQPGADRALLRLFFGAPDLPPVAPDILRVHSGRFARAIQVYQRYADHGLSLTDATNLVLVQERRIGFLATTDGGFAGLVPVMNLRTMA